MSELKQSWDNFTANVQNTVDLLKSALSKCEDHKERVTAFEKWLDATENKLSIEPDTHGELSEMKTILDGFKNLAKQIENKGTDDLQRIINDAHDLSAWTKTPNKTDDVNSLQARWEKVKAKCDERIENMNGEMSDYNAYYQKLQDTEKWLLQGRF